MARAITEQWDGIMAKIKMAREQEQKADQEEE